MKEFRFLNNSGPPFTYVLTPHRFDGVCKLTCAQCLTRKHRTSALRKPGPNRVYQAIFDNGLIDDVTDDVIEVS